MFDLEVLDATILDYLHLTAWSDIPAIATLLARSQATTSHDNNLVICLKSVSRKTRDEVVTSLTEAAAVLDPELLFSGFGLKAYYRGRVFLGNLLHLDVMSYTDYRHPTVFGNVVNQPCGHSTITILSGRRTLQLLLDRWKRRFSSEYSHAATLRVAASQRAIQIRLCCAHVNLDDVVDIVVEGSFAVQQAKKSAMILGLSFTQAVMVKNDPLASARLKEVNVEEVYGPFVDIR